MAPVTSLTDTLFVDYVTTRLTHTFSLHARVGVTRAALILATRTFLTDVAGYFHIDTVFEAARVRGANQSFTIGVEWTPIEGTAAGTMDAYQETAQLGFGGRGDDGVRTTFQLYGHFIQPSDNFRLTLGETEAASDLILAWQTLSASVGTTTGSPLVVVRPYLNTRFNSYQQTRQRP